MNKKGLLLIIIVVLALSIGSVGAAYAQGGRGNGRGGQGGNSGPTYGNGWGDGSGLGINATSTLPDAVIEALEAGLNDEYNAYATYGAIIDQFGAVAPFTYIQRAENQHILVLTRAFTRYGLDVPEPTTVVVPTFDSLTEACAVGVVAEVANLGLYDQWLSTVSDYPDLVRVFTALRNASEFRHLPALEACAALN